MAKSFKYKDNKYLDSTGIVHNKELLSEILTPKILFSNENGETSTVNLFDTAANYKYIEIYYKDYENGYDFTKIYSPNGKIVELVTSCANVSDANIYKRGARATISDKTITLSNQSQEYWVNGVRYFSELWNAIKVVRVIGLK